MKRALTAWLLIVGPILAACGDDGTAPESRQVAGVDLTELFAPPSQAEIQAILDEWAGRSVQVGDILDEASVPISLGGTPGTLRIVSHLVDGNRHVGGVLAPDDAPPASLPILVYSHGGDRGTSESELRGVALALDELADDVVVVAPSFRAEPFRFQNRELVSEGEPSPWDRDVDDALALLRVAKAVAPAADTTRVGVLGFSRGAAVGLLMGIRDPIVDRVVAFFGPTDFFDSWVQEVTEEALRGELRDLPGLDVLNREFIQPLRSGNLSIDDVRPEIIRRSAVLYALRLPPLQLHHGLADEIVPVSQAQRMIETMEALNRTEDEFQAFLYEDGIHNPLTLTGSFDRTSAFLTPLLSGPAAVAYRR